MLRVATLDEDRDFGAVLGEHLCRAGWEQVELAPNVGLASIAPMRLHAVVVDLVVLGPRCWEWLEELCRVLPELPVVVCTGASTVAQRVRGLRLGADDWISKPCHPDELVARVESRVRRGVPPQRAARILAGAVEIRSDQRVALVEGRSIDLTPRQFDLFELLAAAQGRVLEREFIYQRLWGYAMVRGDRSVDVFVRKLRQKLEAASPGWRYIHTHFSVGYSFAAEPPDAPAPPDAPNVGPTTERERSSLVGLARQG